MRSADRRGTIRLWNPGAEALFGYSAEEVVGRSLDVIIPDRLRPAHWRAFDQAVETGCTKYGRQVMVTRSVHKNGQTLYVDLSFAVVNDASRETLGAVAIARDATQRYLSETALRKRVTELEAQLKVSFAAPPSRG
jgi:PAS domain S-box-containing protein